MKRLIASLLTALMLLAGLTACGAPSSVSGEDTAGQQPPDATQSDAAAEDTAAETPLSNGDTSGAETSAAGPKYVFLFIGDGMSYPQFQAAADYLGALEDEDYLLAEPSLDDNQGAVLDGPVALNFMGFEAAGSAVTYDSNSFAPDSASTATSIATGYKTYSGSINVDETGTVSYETIAEKLHEQMGWKIGVITSVNLNHATPAAFYAHQASRSSYYEIGLELVDSGFEYFAGGGLLSPTGREEDQTDLYTLAAGAGYTVVNTQAEAEAISAGTEKVLITGEQLADSDALDYELDRAEDTWSLADYVSKGIEVLDNDTGFFMKCEGGKIDWACHANDAGSTIQDTLALADAVQVAIDFAAEHPEETLILVTGDHETGGLTIGFAGTDYDTYLSMLEHQTISYAQFDEKYVSAYRENGTSFEEAMADVEALFGLKLSGGEDDLLVLTEYETERLRTAYELAMSDYDAGAYTQEQYNLYGGYNPFSVTVTHILNNKSGVDFTSYSHTGLPVAVFADGVGASDFKGYYDNTEIYHKLAALTGVQ